MFDISGPPAERFPRPASQIAAGFNLGVPGKAFAAIGIEVEAWRAQPDQGSPSQPRFPDGWTPVARGPVGPDAVGTVLRRERGGWVLDFHDENTGRHQVVWVSPTLAVMFARATQVPAALASPSDADREALVRTALASLYDLADPVERAEGTVFAIGGPLTAPPQGDRPHGDAAGSPE